MDDLVRNILRRCPKFIVSSHNFSGGSRTGQYVIWEENFYEPVHGSISPLFHSLSPSDAPGKDVSLRAVYHAAEPTSDQFTGEVGQCWFQANYWFQSQTKRFGILENKSPVFIFAGSMKQGGVDYLVRTFADKHKQDCNNYSDWPIAERPANYLELRVAHNPFKGQQQQYVQFGLVFPDYMFTQSPDKIVMLHRVLDPQKRLDFLRELFPAELVAAFAPSIVNPEYIWTRLDINR